jgi:hypothetical protein
MDLEEISTAQMDVPHRASEHNAIICLSIHQLAQVVEQFPGLAVMIFR